MPKKRVVVNLSEKYDNIRIPRSLLPAENNNVYTEQVILYISPPCVENTSEWDMQLDNTINRKKEKRNNNSNNNVNEDDIISSFTPAERFSSWTPAPLLGEQDTARASLTYMVKPPRSPIMRGRLSRSPK
ncbi:uncharacterized protein TM35_000132560 [Trypanosoma theileri]|uniref:Uncharacterized protein n=1 Tax=Trypanosoma theileri TaxID=67003 RepID=A0A1X0NX51_9TRYP|nr:uncharacterized protein TM35_000132560 [Trypanosoma theileri]ORC89252.1 hypothetical protein TM35_000132560 [Trypanosoma theileri]